MRLTARVGIAVVVFGAVAALAWLRPWARADVIVPGHVRGASLTDHTLVVVVDDLSRPHPEQPIDPMKILRVTPGQPPAVIAADLVDVKSIAASRTHVFFRVRSVIGAAKIFAVPLAGGTPRPVATNDDTSPLVASGDHAWFIDKLGDLAEVSALADEASMIASVVDARCLVADERGLVVVTKDKILTLEADPQVRFVAVVRIDRCEASVLGDEIALASWTEGKRDGAVARIPRNGGTVVTELLDQGAFLRPWLTPRGIVFRSAIGGRVRVLVKPRDLGATPTELLGGDVSEYWVDGADLYFIREDGSDGLLHRRW